MKSRIESGAERRAVAGASADSRRGVASVGREIERCELSSGYAVIVGRKAIDSSGEIVSEYLKADGSGTAFYPYEYVITDYADACEKCAAVMRESASEEEMHDYPPPEFPRVVFVRLFASVMGVA